MKNYIKGALLALVLTFGSFGLSYSIANASAAYDWHWNLRDSTNTGDYNFDLTPPGDSEFKFVLLNPTYNYPSFWGLGTGLYADSGFISIHDLSPAQMPIVNTFIGTTLEALSAHDLQILALNVATTSLKAQINGLSGYTQVQSDWNQTSTTSPAYVKNKPTVTQADWNTVSTTSASYIKNRPPIWVNGVATTSEKQLVFKGTITSGVATFYITSDGTSGGTALCYAAPDHVNVIVNDPDNTFGVGYTVTNSNKNLNITVNARSFSATTILGISVLGSSSLSAATNGTEVSALVVCH